MREMDQALHALPRQGQEFFRLIKQIRQSARLGEWKDIPPSIIRAVELQGGQANLAMPWADLVRDLVRLWDMRNPLYTPTRKQESLERVLIHFSNEPDVLNEKLTALLQAWNDTNGGASEPIAATTATDDAPIETESSDPAWRNWQEAVTQVLERGVLPALAHDPELAEEVRQISREAHALGNEHDLQKWLPRLKKLWLKIELQGQQERRLTDGLLNLLRLLTDNMGELVVDDGWLQGQVAVVQAIMARPLDMRLIYDAEAGLKEVIYKQSLLKHNLHDAQTTLKSMATTFLDRLGSLSVSTEQYQEKIRQYAEKVQTADNPASLKFVLDDIMHDTRTLQLDVLRSRDELIEARQEADVAQQRVMQLERELREVSEKVREDQLTGALNRRGLEDAYEVELSRMGRKNSPMALALLDIDNFKKLNDQMGHAAGDNALVHLVQVVRELLRPTDVVARYGGEEFVLLLPDTDLDDAIQILQRLQRELTRRIFMHNNDKLLITFSAGVTMVSPGEHRAHAIERADHGMYRAKLLGKNRVEAEESTTPDEKPAA
ncbi:GGDEF domain-containing protein [Jeongeupia sp. HS-3]|uniref:GGDEF domain-containing protein n=1 Tax=Jeongeupia sp. HS-3 TaxID=1009682 RepID=UPI001F1D1772|nr:GGDEF domain-containing protein [Jeongeupia sp. HS-3]